MLLAAGAPEERRIARLRELEEALEATREALEAFTAIEAMEFLRAPLEDPLEPGMRERRVAAWQRWLRARHLVLRALERWGEGQPGGAGAVAAPFGALISRGPPSAAR